MNAATMDDRWWKAALALMTVCGALLMAWVVRGGCEVSEDSTHYLSGALNLAESGRYWTSAAEPGGFIRHWPPLYSASLALIIKGGGTWMLATKAMAVLTFAGSLLGTGLLLGMSGAPRLWSLLLTGLLGAAGIHLMMFTLVCADGLFCLLTVWLSVCLVQAMRTGSWRWLLPAAVLGGLSGITKQFAFPVLACACFAVLFGRNGTWRDRWRRAAGFGGIAALPAFLFTLRNRAVGGSSLSMEVTWRGWPQEFGVNTWEYLCQLTGLSVWPQWVVFRPWLKLGMVGSAALVLVAALVVIVRNRRQWKADGEVRAFLWAIAVYIVFYFLMCASVAIDMVVPANMERYYAPLVPAAVFVCLRAAWLGRGDAAVAGLRVWSSVLLLFYLAGRARMALAMLPMLPLEGGMFASAPLRDSPVWAWLARVPAGTEIVTNEPAPVWLWSGGRTAARTPQELNHQTGIRRSPAEMDALMGALAEKVREGRSVVLFHRPSQYWFCPPEEDIRRWFAGAGIEEHGVWITVRKPDADGAAPPSPP